MDLSVVVARDASSSSSSLANYSTRITVVIYHVINQWMCLVENASSSSFSTSIFDSVTCVSSCICSCNCIYYY